MRDKKEELPRPDLQLEAEVAVERRNHTPPCAPCSAWDPFYG
jgi:hypothetical protein